MSNTNGRLDYSRLVSDIDFAGAFEGTRFEQYTDTETEGGLGSVVGGWLGAAVGRFVGMALGQVAQELVVDELFGTTTDDESDESEAADEPATEEQPTDSDEPTEGDESVDSDESTESDEEKAEADAE